MIPLIIAILFFILFYLLLLYSFNSAFTAKADVKIKKENISVIIAAKNESKNIPALIKGLNSIEYPKENFEIVFIDDGSEDKTEELFNSLIDKTIDYKVLKSDNKIYPAKKGALALGIEASKYPNIVITDADCIVPPEWLQHYSVKFSHGYDFVIGVAPFIIGNNFANLLSCFENMRSIFLSFSLASLGMPYNAAARNIGFKKESYIKVSGYKNTTETISGDDDLLLREMQKQNYKIGLMTVRESFVYSNTVENLNMFFKQRGRHTTTSFHYLLSVKIILGIWHLLNIVFLFSPVLVFYNIWLISPFIIKLMFDFIFVLNVKKKLSYTFKSHQIFYLQIFYELHLIISIFRAKFIKSSWK